MGYKIILIVLVGLLIFITLLFYIFNLISDRLKLKTFLCSIILIPFIYFYIKLINMSLLSSSLVYWLKEVNLILKFMTLWLSIYLLASNNEEQISHIEDIWIKY